MVIVKIEAMGLHYAVEVIFLILKLTMKRRLQLSKTKHTILRKTNQIPEYSLVEQSCLITAVHIVLKENSVIQLNNYKNKNKKRPLIPPKNDV